MLGTGDEIRLHLNLLGTFEADLDGLPLDSFRSDKVRALLAYLATEAGRPHRREALATLLWGEFPERDARRSLSQALSNLRRLLSPAPSSRIRLPGGGSPWLTISRHSVEFNLNDSIWIDVYAFDNLLSPGSGQPASSAIEGASLSSLARATSLYRGPFLAGLTLPDCPEFEEWRLLHSEQRHQAALLALEQLTARYLAQGDYRQARHYARQQLALEPWREHAHRQLMRALAMDGQRGAALQQYDICIQQLGRELGVGAEAETIALREQVWRGELVAAKAQPLGSESEHPLPPCPYRGLFPFGPQDARWFFGRAAFNQRLVDAVHREPVVAVLGPSGSGKSSVVFAGLLPRLQQAAAAGDEQPDAPPWQIATLRPGAHPIHALVTALVPYLAPGADSRARLAMTAKLVRGLDQAEITLCEAMGLEQEDATETPSGRQAGPPGAVTGRTERLLLVVDQFEELYTLCRDPDARQTFLRILLDDLSREPVPPCTLLLTLRADFLGEVLTHRPLADALQRGSLILGPMTREALARAVEQPALAQGVPFEPGLVQRILQDVGDEPGNLPLLQFALTALWERQAAGSQLTHAAYDATGRVQGALANYAEEFYAQLDPDERETARRVLVNLVRPGRQARDTRRRVTRAELGPEDWQMVQRLADARLVVSGREPGGEETAELVHEALIDGWGRLDVWLNEDRAYRIWWERLRASLRAWIASGRDEDALLRGNPLAEAEEWLDQRGEDLAPVAWEYIVVGIAKREQERKAAEAQRQRELDQVQALAEAERRRADAEHQRADAVARSRYRLRWLLAALGALFLVALFAAGVAYRQGVIAREQAQAAQAAQAVAEIERTKAREQAGIALAESRRAEVQAQAAKVQARLALSRQLAAQAVTLLDKELDLALLLNLEARRLAEPGAERGAYLSSLAFSPYVSRFLHGHDDAVIELKVDGDGRTVTSLDTHGGVIVWDLDTGQPLHQLPSQEAETIGTLSASSRIAAVAQGQEILLWDAVTGQPLGQPLEGHAASIRNLSLNGDGSVLVSGDADGAISVWDIQPSGARRRSLAQPLAYDGSGILAVRPDGRRLAMAAKGANLDVYDLETGALLAQNEAVHPGYALHHLVYSPDGSVLATSSFDKTVMLWDAETIEALGPPLEGHEGRVLAATFSPDGRTLASASTDNTLRVWDVSPLIEGSGSGARPLAVPLAAHSNWIRSVAFFADGTELVSGDSDGKTIVWDLARSRQLAGHQAQVRGLSFSPDGRSLASGSLDTSVMLWDTASGEPASPPLTDHPKNVLNVAFSPDGHHIASVGSGEWVILWELERAGGMPQGYPLEGHTGQVYAVAFSPDGRTLATGNRDGDIILWDVESQQARALRTKAHDGWVLGLAFSPDGSILASASQDGTARLWDLSGLRTGASAGGGTGVGTAKAPLEASGNLVKPLGAPLMGHSGWVNSVAFSQDGSRLATSSSDNTVRIWDPGRCMEPGAGTCEPLGPPLTGHATQVWSVVFHPSGEGRILVSGGADGTVLAWDLSSFEPLEPPLLGNIEMETMALSPDGQTLALGALDPSGLVHLWQLDLTPWEQRGCEIANRNLTEAEWRQYLDDTPYHKTCPDLP